MSSTTTQFVQAGYQLVITSNAVSKGYFHEIGIPGSQSGGLTAVNYNESHVVEPVNYNRTFAIVSDQGTISFVVDFDYIEDVASSLDDLDDVVITDLLEDDILKYDGAKWVNSFTTPGSGATELDELSDVTLGALVNRHGLMYSSGSGQWENRLLVEADISDLGNYLTDINSEVLDDLSDVNIVAPSNGEVLKYNGGVWSNATDEGISAAADVSYDNTTSLLTATDVQAAIDELDVTLDSLADVAFSGDYDDLSNTPSIPSQYTDELAQDAVSTMIQNGTGITWSYNDSLNTLTPTVTITQYTDEMVQDVASTMIQNGTGITWSYNDSSGTLTPTVTITQYTDELAQDAVGTILDDSTFISAVYSDATPSITMSLSATGTPDSTTFLRGDNTWATPSGGSSTFPAIGAVSGQWYGTPGLFFDCDATAQNTVDTGTIYYIPFYVTKTNTYTAIGILVGTSVAGSTNMAIYNSDSSNTVPTGNPIAGSTSGSITNVTATLASFTFASPIELQPGMYWLAYTLSTGSCQYINMGADASRLSLIGVDTTVTTTTCANYVVGWKHSFTYSTTMPTVSTLTKLLKSSVGESAMFLKGQ